MIIFCHYLIIIAICYGCIEAAEITMENIANFQVISFPGVFLSAARKLGLDLLQHFCLFIAAPCDLWKNMPKKRVDIYYGS